MYVLDFGESIKWANVIDGLSVFCISPDSLSDSKNIITKGRGLEFAQ